MTTLAGRERDTDAKENRNWLGEATREWETKRYNDNAIVQSKEIGRKKHDRHTTHDALLSSMRACTLVCV